MSVTANVNVYGVREALSELRKIDPKLRAEAVRKVKAAGNELTAAAAVEYPATAPLSGWQSTGRLGYTGPKAKRGVKIEVGGRTPKRATAYPIVTLVQGNAGAALWDIAGLRGGAKSRGGPRQRPNFIQILDARFGPAQRGLWKARNLVDEVATRKIIAALEDVAASVNRKLV